MPPVAAAQSPDVAVVGGGPIGLACAWRAARRGLSAVVLDAGGPGAWHVAAGMLAPVAEAEFGERALLELGLRSAAMFEAFCAELAEATGRDPGLRRSGTLVVARDADEAEALERLIAFRGSLGLEVTRLRPSQARRARARARADRAAGARGRGRPLDRPAAARRGAAARPSRCRRGRVARVLAEDGRVTGVELEDGSVLAAGAVVLAAGRARRRDRAARGRGARARAPGQGPGAAAARPARPRPRRAHDPRRAGLPRPARRRPLRARRDDGGARLGHRADGRRRLRADPRHERARPRRARAGDRGARGRAAPRHPRQPAGDRPRRARGPRVGDRPPPQRHPARRPSRPSSWPARWPASRCRTGRAPADPARFAGVPA